MEIGNLTNTIITVGEIPEGECFVLESQLYIKTARFDRTYEALISGLIEDEAGYFSTHCICVNLSDGSLDAFSPDQPCKKVLTKVSVVPG